MKINNIDYQRVYIRIEHLFQFKRLMEKNQIELISEKELLTNINSQTFYVKKSEINLVDKICLQYNIEIHDDYTPHITDRYSLEKLSKPIRITVQIILIILVLLYLFQEYI